MLSGWNRDASLVKNFLTSLGVAVNGSSMLSKDELPSLNVKLIDKTKINNAIKEVRHTIASNQNSIMLLLALSKLLSKLDIKNLTDSNVNKGKVNDFFEELKNIIFDLYCFNDYLNNDLSFPALKSDDLEAEKILDGLWREKHDLEAKAVAYDAKKRIYDKMYRESIVHFDAVLDGIATDLEVLAEEKDQLVDQNTEIKQPVIKLEEQISKQEEKIKKLYDDIGKAQKEVIKKEFYSNATCDEYYGGRNCTSSCNHSGYRDVKVNEPDYAGRESSGYFWVNARNELLNLKIIHTAILSHSEERVDKVKSLISQEIEAIIPFIMDFNDQARNAKKEVGKEKVRVDENYDWRIRYEWVPIYEPDGNTQTVMAKISAKLQLYSNGLKSLIASPDDSILKEKISKLEENNSITFSFNLKAWQDNDAKITELSQKYGVVSELMKELEKKISPLFGLATDNTTNTTMLEKALRLRYDPSLYEILAEIYLLPDSEEIHTRILQGIIGLQSDSVFGIENFYRKLDELDKRQAEAFLWGLVTVNDEDLPNKVYYLLVLLMTSAVQLPDSQKIKLLAYTSALHAVPGSVIDEEEIGKLDKVFSESIQNPKLNDKITKAIEALQETQSKPLKDNLLPFLSLLDERSKAGPPEQQVGALLNELQLLAL